VDFSRDASGNPLEPGKYLENEYAAYGLTLSASGGVGLLPRLLDTANPVDGECGDPDLGAPNMRCPGGGPGEGEDGEPDGRGPNCNPLGNVLIVQEPGENCPDDNVDGGEIVFDFNPKADYVSSIGLLDVDYATALTVRYMDNYGAMRTKNIQVPTLGDNSYQDLSINIARVSKITLTMRRSAGVSSISFCYPRVPVAPPTFAPPTPAPPTPAPPTPTPPTAGGCSLTKVDFNKDAKGNYLNRGDYVSNQWADYGLVLSSIGGFGTRPRLFDTANPGTNQYGDPDLGAPNEACPGGGPGWGAGGQPGTPGENCSPQGLALIVQEVNNSMEIPDDNGDGGTIVMDFTEPGGQYVKEIGLLDMDYSADVIVEYLTSSGSIATRIIPVSILGDNSYQVVEIDQANVKWLKLRMQRSGAVTFITFCRN
jgi:hypothetical protein